MTRAHVLADVQAALDRLHADGSNRVGMLGLSVGGHIAYLAAAALDLQATAIAYAGWLTTTDIPLSRPEPTLTMTPEIRTPVLYLVGECDRLILARQRHQIAAALQSSAVAHTVVEYPGVQHGFLHSRRATYDPEASRDAWQRIRRHFELHLRCPGSPSRPVTIDP